MSTKKNDLTIIVGCGTLGSQVANHIYNNGANVIVIDRLPNSFSRLDSSFGGLTIVGDACDFEVLRRAEIERATTLLAVTDFENNNIFVGQAAKLLFHVDNVIVRVIDKSKEAIYKDMGISTVCPSELSANAVIEFYQGGKNA
ncbi:MAG: TrkA family potassium uptake protein [Erysipelotrichaceae bacterium]|nr:TrkA family potassium uptake protein [Erysipelotrichaceae bacterium]